MAGGLKLHIPMWEGAGTAYDYGRHFVNHGSTFSGAAWLKTPYGWAIDCSGGTLVCGSDAYIDDAEPFSISFWALLRTKTSGDDLFSKDGGTSSGAWKFHIESASGSRFGFFKDRPSTDIRQRWDVITLGDLVHYVMWWDGTDNSSGTAIQLYKNGAVQTIASSIAGGAARSDATLNLEFGTFDGYIFDARLYDGILNDRQIMSLYKEPFADQIVPRRKSFAVPAAGGLGIPIAAYHYNHNVGSNL